MLSICPRLIEGNSRGGLRHPTTGCSAVCVTTLNRDISRMSDRINKNEKSCPNHHMHISDTSGQVPLSLVCQSKSSTFVFKWDFSIRSLIRELSTFKIVTQTVEHPVVLGFLMLFK